MKYSSIFAINGKDCILEPEDCGIVNGHLCMVTPYNDVAHIQSLYAPPLFSDDFFLYVRFNGKRVWTTDYVWEPDMLTRRGDSGNWHVQTGLVLMAGRRAAMLHCTVSNNGEEDAELNVQYEMTGALGRQETWQFSRPIKAPFATHHWADGVFSLAVADDRIALASTLQLTPQEHLKAGLLDAAPLIVPAGHSVEFWTFLAIDECAASFESIETMRKNPQESFDASRRAWEKLCDALFAAMPDIESDSEALTKLYHRSLLHLLLNEWSVPEFKLKPFYTTGSINGCCTCCYLWNYGEPYRLWSILSPTSAKEHIRAFLSVDLANCYALATDGGPIGPYYPVNQEKIILLTHTYVMQTGDKKFLDESLNGKSVLEHLLEQALLHDDLAKPAVLVDYGDGNHHLELRGKLRYDGILPDLNLRRCVNYHLVQELYDVMGIKPPVDLIQRAENLKQLIHNELYSPQDGWFFAVARDGSRYLRYTIQMFKALGWGDWALTSESEKALTAHLMNPKEFLGRYGIHSMSKLDPAYDERDVDNGGPGACVSFAPAVVDRLYQCGATADASEIMSRLLWKGGVLPYFGDSQRADVMDYWRKTPLQCDIEGAAFVQTIVFGMLGTRIGRDFAVTFNPSLLDGVNYLHVKNLRLCGKIYDVTVERDGQGKIKVRCS
ncbi:MAG: hypothetical protein J6X55_01825 [Victivallales bacterium]|nr:hypothetical protein [Victivallales bacterium]